MVKNIHIWILLWKNQDVFMTKDKCDVKNIYKLQVLILYFFNLNYNENYISNRWKWFHSSHLVDVC